jgi:CRISPR-associated protein Cas2
VSLTLIVTRDVAPRYRGFLASSLLEVSAGVYVSPRLNSDTRERIWSTLSDWHRTLQRGSIVMVWQDRSALDRVGLAILGEPPKDLVMCDGLLLTRRPFLSR